MILFAFYLVAGCHAHAISITGMARVGMLVIRYWDFVIDSTFCLVILNAVKNLPLAIHYPLITNHFSIVIRHYNKGWQPQASPRAWGCLFTLEN